MTALDTGTIKCIRNKQDTYIDKFVLNSNYTSIYHMTAWSKVIHEVFNHDTYYIYIELTNNDVIGVLPIVHLKSRLFGNYMVSMPYFNYGGAVANNKNDEDKMITRAIELAAELGAQHIEFRDVDSRGDMWPARKDKVNMILELPASVDLLSHAIGTKKRTKIRRPLKEGVKSFIGGVELLDKFYEVFAINMRDLGTPVYSKKFFYEILKTFKDETKIVVLQLHGKPISAAFLIGFKEKLEIPWASTINQYNRFSPNMLLYWEVLTFAIESGYKEFDFGRSTIDSGTYQFKQQWGAKPKQLYWHYWLAQGNDMPQLTPNNTKYKLAIKAWQHLPVVVTKWIGPGIIKNLP
ncbi:MAG: FemAB family PEP-CTERM system-associated protein [Gammaproteobacteria bacterium]|nr:FemAB family PEP-CTERM system-associated protein [Gammaproteobacteria bacterium]